MAAAAWSERKGGSLTDHRVLSGSERARLIAAATGVVLLIYALALLSLVFLALYLIGGAFVAIGAARVGMTGFVVGGLKGPEELIRLLARSLFLPKQCVTHVEIAAEDAPRLFALIDSVAARAGVTAPDRTVLEIHCNAGVHLGGYLTGSGRTMLALGLDLLAGVSERQLEAVIAHEMAHARLTQRGINAWLVRAIIRAWRLAGAVERFADQFEPKKLPMSVAATRWWATPLAQLAGRLESAYSRQDEFSADRLAAELCGSKLCGETLARIEEMGARSASIPWHERLVQARRARPYVDWVRGRLESSPDPAIPIISPAEEGEYDSHPSLAARLEALPASEATGFGTDAPALELLRDPDRHVERLIDKMGEVAAAAEAEDTRELVKLASKDLPTTQKLQLIFGGVLLFMVALAVFLAELSLFGLLFTASGAAMVAWATLRPITPLPMPSLAHWEKALRSRDATRIQALAPPPPPPLTLEAPDDIKGRKALAEFWAETTYDALLRCEYERAWVASRECLALAPKRMEGLLADGILQAFYRQGDRWMAGVHAGLQSIGLSGPVPWAAAWALVLAGDLPMAEGYAAVAARKAPKEATRWLYLAWIQWSGQRHYVALESARRAVRTDPESTDARLILARILLDLVRPREALEQLAEMERLGGWAARDMEVMFLRFRAHLLLGQADEAQQAAERLRTVHPGPTTVHSLGNGYYNAWMPREAKKAYLEALEGGFFPVALAGLAMMACEAGQRAEARRLLLAALDQTRATPEEATGNIPLMGRLLNDLLMLNDVRPHCSGWNVGVDGSHLPHGRGLRLLVAAGSAEEAGEFAREFYGGLMPQGDPTQAVRPATPASPEEFKRGPARPGVCALYSE